MKPIRHLVALLLALLTCVSARANSSPFEVLHSFSSSNFASSGSRNLVQGTDGYLYGVTEGDHVSSFGEIYQLKADGTYTVLHAFDETEAGCNTELIQLADGNFYGLTAAGLFFNVTTNGVFTVLKDFGHYNIPTGLAYSNGHFYMTTQGMDGDLISQLETDGTTTVLYSFTHADDGGYPHGLTVGTDGNIYGLSVRFFYSPGNPPEYMGSVLFKLTPSGTFTVIRSFDYATEAAGFGSVVRMADGTLYGVQGSQPFHNYAIYKIAPDGTFSIVRTFYNASEGAPSGELALGADGNLYGTMDNDSGSFSSIYRVTPWGDFGVVQTVSVPNAGTSAYRPLLVGNDGYIYGSTSQGFSSGDGIAFRFTPAPMIKANPEDKTAALGANVTFTVTATPYSGALTYQWQKNGTNIVGATNATFNITSVTASDYASYTVVVSDAHGSIISYPVRLYKLMAGVYTGLFYDVYNGLAQESSGLFKITLGTTPSYSGSLMVDGDTLSFSGKANKVGEATNVISRAKFGKPDLTVRLLPLDCNTYGAIIERTSSWISYGTADRAVYSKTNTTTAAGSYTFNVGNSFSGSAQTPLGASGSVLISTNGTVVITAYMADGTKTSQTVPLGGHGQIPLYLPLYPNKVIATNYTNNLLTTVITTSKGSMFCPITRIGSRLGGTLGWIKTACTNTLLYTNGFTSLRNFSAETYTPPAVGTRPIPFMFGTSSLTGDGVSDTDYFLAQKSGRIYFENETLSKTITFAPKTGLFSGTFIHPVTQKRVTMTGAYSQSTSTFTGYFPGVNETGSIRLMQY